MSHAFRQTAEWLQERLKKNLPREGRTEIRPADRQTQGADSVIPRNPCVSEIGATAPRKRTTISAIEEQMQSHIACVIVPRFPYLWTRQFRPFPDRKWKLDFAIPTIKFAVEVDGSVHRIKARFKDSFERSFWLMRAGWTVLHVGGDQVRSGEAVTWLEQLLQQAQDREEARRHR